MVGGRYSLRKGVKGVPLMKSPSKNSQILDTLKPQAWFRTVLLKISEVC